MLFFDPRLPLLRAAGLILLGLCLGSGALFGQSASLHYKKGQLHSMKMEWEDALREYRAVTDEYPGSDQEEAALFWQGFCLEKIPDRQKEAFQVFGTLAAKFPESEWGDDAMMSQVNLAGQFLQNGDEQYRAFLHQKLDNPQPELRVRAALVLARAGDKAALPVLETLRQDSGDERAALADELYRNLTSPAAEEPRGEGEDGALFRGSDRYRHYKNLLRSDQNWNAGQLRDYGLLSVLDDRRYGEYSGLDEAGKAAWLKRFWKQEDPTPTTEKNELLEAFEERVAYAHRHFYQSVRDAGKKFLADQYIRFDRPHAPWDARGELYIKFGKPSYRSVVGFQTEQWSYDQLGVDFWVRLYRTNIYGKALHGNTYHNRYRKDPSDAERVEANYIYTPQIFFQLDLDARNIEGVKVHLNRSGSENALAYHFPKEAFSTKSLDGRQQIRYLERLMVYDGEMNPVKTAENERLVDSRSIDGDEIHGEIKLDLPPGNYWVGLRLEDLQDKRIGLFRMPLKIAP